MRRRNRTPAEREAHKARCRAYRQRQADGEIVTPLPHRLNESSAMMLAMGRLRADQVDDRQAVEKAVREWWAERLAEFSRDASRTAPPAAATRRQDPT